MYSILPVTDMRAWSVALVTESPGLPERRFFYEEAVRPHCRAGSSDALGRMKLRKILAMNLTIADFLCLSMRESLHVCGSSLLRLSADGERTLSQNFTENPSRYHCWIRQGLAPLCL